MTRVSTFFVLVILAGFALQSCDKKNSDCPFIAPNAVFVGFTESESDTLIFRRYAKDGQFSTPLDTMLITKANIIRKVVGQDSVTLTSAGYKQFNNELFANDFEIFLPGVNRTYRISDVAATFTQEREPSATCQSFANTVNVNGTVYKYTSYFDTPYRIYLVK